MLWTALCLALLSWPLQVFSHATTCNNGSYSAFMAGSVTTTPLLLAIAFFLLANRKTSRSRVAAAIAVAACQFTMVLFDIDIVINTIVHGTPCGADYGDAFVQVSALHRLLIIFAYLVMPLVNILLACLFILRSERLKQRRGLNV